MRRKDINLLTPLVRELPIVIVFFLLIKGSMLQLSNPDLWGGVFPCITIVATWVVYVYIMAASIYLVGKVWFRCLWYVFLFSLFAVASFVATCFNLSVSPVLVTLVAETNARETSEFFQTYLFTQASAIAFLKVFVYIIFAVLLEFGYRKYILSRPRVCNFRSMVCSVLLVIFVCLGIYRWSQYSDYFLLNRPDYTDTLSKKDYPTNDIYTILFCSVSMQIKQSGVLDSTIDMSIQAEAPTLDQSAVGDSLNIIFVIGESYNKRHASIYGYPLPTTPNMEAQRDSGNLFVFNDVITMFNYTSMSIKNMMSCNSVCDGEEWAYYPYFPTLFRKAGYDVYLWDNQRDFFSDSFIQYATNSYLHNPRLAKATYTDMNAEVFEYDCQLIENLQPFIKKSKGNNLFLLHLMGQHQGYALRFPHKKEFLKFSLKDIHRNESYMNDVKRQKIADYDNATYYNDYVLSQLMESFSNRNAVLIYLSDHGEEIYDFRNHMGRSYSTVVNIFQFGVPFVVWCSDLFKNRHPETIELIRHALDRPFMIDNVCQLLFHLGGLQTKFYHPERDVISPSYVIKDRMIQGGVTNYDQFRRDSAATVPLY